MTSKTFKSAGNPEAAISVVPSADGVRTMHVHGIEASGVTVPCEDAPALALAILEAAGGRDSLGIDVGNAITDLREYVTEQERITAEARERAELEAEALELHNAFWAGLEEKQLDSWDDERGNAKNSWVSAARRAREMRAEK